MTARACICPPDAVVANCPAHNDWPTAPEFAHELTDGVEGYRAYRAQARELLASDWLTADRAAERERIAQAILAEGARLAAQHHEASEAHGRIKTMAAAFAAVARGVV